MHYLIDLDGTLYRGNSPVPYAKEFITYLNENKRNYLILTNCPGNTPSFLVKKLNIMGIHVKEQNILTSGQAVASYIAKHHKGKRVFLIGEEALEKELQKKGAEIVDFQPDSVVVGFDRQFSYDKLKKASQFIMEGAAFIVTNGDYTIPDGNYIIPHTGSIALSIEAATGVKPVIVGKPEKYMLNEALDLLECSKEICCIIGDRLDTDILMGQNHGVSSYLVLTGVTSSTDVKNSSIKPTQVFNNLNEVLILDQGFINK